MLTNETRITIPLLKDCIFWKGRPLRVMSEFYRGLYCTPYNWLPNSNIVWLADTNYRIDLPNDNVRLMVDADELDALVAADQVRTFFLDDWSEYLVLTTFSYSWRKWWIRKSHFRIMKKGHWRSAPHTNMIFSRSTTTRVRNSVSLPGQVCDRRVVVSLRYWNSVRSYSVQGRRAKTEGLLKSWAHWIWPQTRFVAKLPIVCPNLIKGIR